MLAQILDFRYNCLMNRKTETKMDNFPKATDFIDRNIAPFACGVIFGVLLVIVRFL
jgi:hypothetical protein